MTMLVIGEIIEAIPPNNENNLSKIRYEYVVRLQTPDGGVYIESNVLALEPLSGVDNFHEVVFRGSKRQQGKGVAYSTDAKDLTFRSGDRVMLCYVGDSGNDLFILGALPHQVLLPEDNLGEDALESMPALYQEADPQLRGRYNGFNYHVDGIGQVRLQYTGAPEIKIEGGLWESSLDKPVSYITTIDFIDKGNFRLVDQTNQGLALNTLEEYISLNNTMEAPNDKREPTKDIKINEVSNLELPKGQELRLDKKNKKATLRSSGDVQLVTGNNFFSHIYNNKETKVFGAENYFVAKDKKLEIGGSYIKSIGKDCILTAKENIGLISQAGNSIFLDSASGREGVYISHTSGAQIVIDKDGSVKMFGADGSYFFINAKSGEVSITTASGALISAKESITISDSSGGQIVSLRDGNAEVSSSGNVTVSGQNVTLNSGAISLGAAAAISAVMGEPLLAWLNTHVHGTAVGPSSPPIVPAPPALLSTSVKVQP